MNVRLFFENILVRVLESFRTTQSSCGIHHFTFRARGRQKRRYNNGFIKTACDTLSHTSGSYCHTSDSALPRGCGLKNSKEMDKCASNFQHCLIATLCSKIMVISGHKLFTDLEINLNQKDFISSWFLYHEFTLCLHHQINTGSLRWPRYCLFEVHLGEDILLSRRQTV